MKIPVIAVRILSLQYLKWLCSVVPLEITKEPKLNDSNLLIVYWAKKEILPSEYPLDSFRNRYKHF